MAQITPSLEPKQEELIIALMDSRSKEEAARKAGVPHSTMYHWLHNPVFMAAYRAARLDSFDEALATLEKNANRAALALVDELDKERATGSGIVMASAIGVLDRAFKAQDAIAVQEELAKLRNTLDELMAGQDSAPVQVAPLSQPEASAAERRRIIMQTEQEQAEACRYRILWMTELGNSVEDVSNSLRWNRPQSALEEKHLLDVVCKQLELERTHDELVRTCTR